MSNGVPVYAETTLPSEQTGVMEVRSIGPKGEYGRYIPVQTDLAQHIGRRGPYGAPAPYWFPLGGDPDLPAPGGSGPSANRNLPAGVGTFDWSLRNLLVLAGVLTAAGLTWRYLTRGTIASRNAMASLWGEELETAPVNILGYEVKTVYGPSDSETVHARDTRTPWATRGWTEIGSIAEVEDGRWRAWTWPEGRTRAFKSRKGSLSWLVSAHMGWK